MDKAIYPLLILDYLRKHSTATLGELLVECAARCGWSNVKDFDDYRKSTKGASFDCSVTLLIQEGFVKVQNPFSPSTYTSRRILNRMPVETQLAITDRLSKIQSVLSFSLTETIDSYLFEKYLRVKPLWDRPDEAEIDAFVIMPFGDAFDLIYHDHIQKVCSKLTLICKRADDIFSSREIMKDIWASIYNAKFLICDCTTINPNVFYELGIAHAIGKKVILVTQQEKDNPFDIKPIRHILYEYTPRGMKVFEKSLANSIDYTLKHPSGK